MGNVRKYDVKKDDMPISVSQSSSFVTALATEVAKPPRRGAYQRIRVALRLLGIGHLEFERERDDRT